MSDLIVLTLYVYGFAIAISALVAMMIKGISIVCARTRQPDDAVSLPETAPAGAAVTAIDEVPIAAISAAVLAVAGPHRIVHIEHGVRSPAWVAAGRARHHLQHSLPRHRH